MPNPRKPRALKQVAGTIQPCRDVPEISLPLCEELPDPPDWLPNVHAVREWVRLVPILDSVGLLTEAGLSPLGNLCALHGKLVQLWSAGESPTGHMLSQYRSLINDFGLTPVAQGKVQQSGEKAKKNRFDRFGS